jgi:hypothetical protein
MTHLVTTAKAHSARQTLDTHHSPKRIVPMTELDTRRHLLSTRLHSWDTSGNAVSRPVSFAEEAAEHRESLAGAPDAERVVISGVEALVSAVLLKEFAARLRHGLAHDAVAPDAEELAQVAADLSERMYRAGGLTD